MTQYKAQWTGDKKYLLENSSLLESSKTKFFASRCSYSLNFCGSIMLSDAMAWFIAKCLSENWTELKTYAINLSIRGFQRVHLPSDDDFGCMYDFRTPEINLQSTYDFSLLLTRLKCANFLQTRMKTMTRCFWMYESARFEFEIEKPLKKAEHR